MQWIYLICFILLSAGLLALFGVKPGDFIDALFRSQRKSATLSDELNVLLGTPAKGFFNQDYELKQILKGTGRADRYEAIKRLSLILFAVGAVLALLIGNVYMVPILGIGFSLIPIWYLRSTAASYKKHLNEELETAISIITTSYLRTEDLIRSVKENLPYINEPVKANFEAFVYEAELINANITSAINSLKMKIPNRVFHEWCGTLIQCQSDRSMKNIAQDFVCYQYDENIPVSYGSDRWDLYFWCNPFNGAADASERDFSYFTLTFNERQTLEKRKKVCQQVLELLCSRFQEHPHLHVAVQYSIWFDHPKIHDAVERAKPRLHGLRCIQEQKEGKLLLQDGALLFKPKYAKKYARTLSQSQILSLSWELGVEDEEPDTDAAPVTLPYKKFGATHPIQLQVTSYLNGNLAIQMVTWESGDPEPWATLTVNLPGQRQKDHAFIDTNADSEFPTWLIRHGLAIPTGRTMQSGFCTYPEYRFRANRLQELDPEGYAGYLKNFERRCSA